MPEKTHAKKRFGQNFLIDTAIIDAIVESAKLTEDDVVLEIGPGTGALTARLAQCAGHVLAVEIDTSLREVLSDTLTKATGANASETPLRSAAEAFVPEKGAAPLRIGNVTVLFADILKCNLDALRKRFTNGRPFKVVANLPYYISTPVLMKLLRDPLPPSSCTVMLQKEMADRMSASPGKKDYGALSVAVQYYATPRIICPVPPSAFRPQPKVDSAVMQLLPLAAAPVAVRDKDFFFRVVEASFAHRRKTLVNSLSADQSLRLSKTRIAEGLFLLEEKHAADAENRTFVIDERVRAERLSMEDFAVLSDFLYC